MELDLGLGGPGPAAPLEIASSRMSHLWNALCRAYDALGFPQATGSDEVFRQLVLARIIEPTSKQDSLRVLEEGRRSRAVVSHAQPAPAGLGAGAVAAAATRRAPHPLRRPGLVPVPAARLPVLRPQPAGCTMQNRVSPDNLDHPPACGRPHSGGRREYRTAERARGDNADADE